MIRHLRWKVVATNMLLISLVLLAVFAAVVLISRANYRESVQQQLYQALESGDYGSRQPGAEGIPCFVAEVYASGTARVAGNSYYDLSDQSQLAAIVTEALAQEEDTGLLEAFHLRYLRRTGYTSTLIAFTDTTLESTTMRSMAAVCSLAGSAALLVLFLCSYLLSGVVTRPVGAAWAQQEQFLSDASHELKTPLTVILSSAELLNQSALPEQAAYIDNIRAEGRRMKLLVEDMLTLSRAQRSAGALPEQTVELSETAVTAALPEITVSLRYDEDGLQRMYLNGEDVTKEIRLPVMSMYASDVSAIPAVRDYLMELQRSLAREHSVIMDGRDIGTVVLPDADVKVFLCADVAVRARRRCLELEKRGTPKPYDQVLKEMEERDYQDTHRAIAPLRPADDAIMIDNTDMDFEASCELLLDVIRGSVGH